MSVDSQQDDCWKVTAVTMPVVFNDTSESAAMPGYRDVACCTEIFDPQQPHRFACRGRIRSVVGANRHVSSFRSDTVCDKVHRWAIGELCMIRSLHSRAAQAARLLAVSFCNLPRPSQSRHHPTPFASTMKLFMCLVLVAITATTTSGAPPGDGPRRNDGLGDPTSYNLVVDSVVAAAGRHG